MATLKSNTPSHIDGATIIGESVQIRGTLSGDEDLHVLGRVDGRIELQRTLVVAESGIVKAEVSVKNAIISGVVVGNVHASESIEITREGRMVGDVFAPRVIIVDGASFRGNVDMGDIENMPARKPGTERPRPTPVAASRPAARPAAPAQGTARPAVAQRPAAQSTAPTAAPAPAPAAAPAAASTRPAPAPSSAPSSAPMEPPAAKGLPQKANKTRVIVKRK